VTPSIRYTADTPPPTPPARPTPTRFVIGVIITGLVAGLAIVYFVLPHWLTTPPVGTPATTPAGAQTAADTRRLVATLYFVADDGASLIGVTSEVPFGGSPAEQARNIVTAQLAAAPSGSVSAIPASVTLRGVYLTPRGDAYVDLSHEIITGHPGGSLNEALTVYTIVNALTNNVREITGVQILVDGKQVDTLAGHIDLRQPLAAGPRWVQKGQ
jgi:hypothetical protein